MARAVMALISTMADTEPPISRSVERALARLVALRTELAQGAGCAHAPAHDNYRRLAPELEHLERFADASDAHVAELRALLSAATELHQQMQRG